MNVRTIAVLGAGTMGHGVAHAAASSGFATRLFDVSDAQLKKAHSTIDGILRKAVELGKLTVADADASIARLGVTSNIANALEEADLVIETGPEKIDIKMQLFA